MPSQIRKYIIAFALLFILAPVAHPGSCSLGNRCYDVPKDDLYCDAQYCGEVADTCKCDYDPSYCSANFPGMGNYYCYTACCDCEPPLPTCGGGGGDCTPNGFDCLKGNECCSGKCGGDFKCVPDGGGGGQCKLEGQACGVGIGNCCSPLVCTGGVCVDPPTCKANGSSCSAASECCSNYCKSDGTCGNPPCSGDGCACTTGATCVSGCCPATTHVCSPADVCGCQPLPFCNSVNPCCPGFVCSCNTDSCYGSCSPQAVCEAPSPAPVLVSPANGTKVSQGTPSVTLTWTPPSNWADCNQSLQRVFVDGVQVSTDLPRTANSFVLNTSIMAEGTHTWQVVALGKRAIGTEYPVASAQWNFIICVGDGGTCSTSGECCNTSATACNYYTNLCNQNCVAPVVTLQEPANSTTFPFGTTSVNLKWNVVNNCEDTTGTSHVLYTRAPGQPTTDSSTYPLSLGSNVYTSTYTVPLQYRCSSGDFVWSVNASNTEGSSSGAWVFRFEAAATTMQYVGPASCLAPRIPSPMQATIPGYQALTDIKFNVRYTNLDGVITNLTYNAIPQTGGSTVFIPDPSQLGVLAPGRYVVSISGASVCTGAVVTLTDTTTGGTEFPFIVVDVPGSSSDTLSVNPAGFIPEGSVANISAFFTSSPTNKLLKVDYYKAKTNTQSTVWTYIGTKLNCHPDATDCNKFAYTTTPADNGIIYFKAEGFSHAYPECPNAYTAETSTSILVGKAHTLSIYVGTEAPFDNKADIKNYYCSQFTGPARISCECTVDYNNPLCSGTGGPSSYWNNGAYIENDNPGIPELPNRPDFTTVQGAKVTLTVGGTALGPVSTDSNGMARFTYTPLGVPNDGLVVSVTCADSSCSLNNGSCGLVSIKKTCDETTVSTGGFSPSPDPAQWVPCSAPGSYGFSYVVGEVPNVTDTETDKAVFLSILVDSQAEPWYSVVDSDVSAQAISVNSCTVKNSTTFSGKLLERVNVNSPYTGGYAFTLGGISGDLAEITDPNPADRYAQNLGESYRDDWFGQYINLNASGLTVPPSAEDLPNGMVLTMGKIYKTTTATINGLINSLHGFNVVASDGTTDGGVAAGAMAIVYVTRQGGDPALTFTKGAVAGSEWKSFVDTGTDNDRLLIVTNSKVDISYDTGYKCDLAGNCGLNVTSTTSCTPHNIDSQCGVNCNKCGTFTCPSLWCTTGATVTNPVSPSDTGATGSVPQIQAAILTLDMVNFDVGRPIGTYATPIKVLGPVIMRNSPGLTRDLGIEINKLHPAEIVSYGQKMLYQLTKMERADHINTGLGNSVVSITYGY